MDINRHWVLVRELADAKGGQRGPPDRNSAAAGLGAPTAAGHTLDIGVTSIEHGYQPRISARRTLLLWEQNSYRFKTPGGTEIVCAPRPTDHRAFST